MSHNPPQHKSLCHGLRAALYSLLGGLALTCLGLAIRPAEAAWAKARPNIVVIETDDQAARLLHSRYVDPYGRVRRTMPNTLSLLARRGTEFTNYYSTYPLCSPSRASLLTGSYSHNTDVLRNGGRHGGYEGYENSYAFDNDLPVWLQRAGYQTMHFGKFLNNYFDPATGKATDEEPPGWDQWASTSYGIGVDYYGYYLNVNGKAEGPFGYAGYDVTGGKDPIGCPLTPGLECNYDTDAMSLRAVSAIRDAGPAPFYLQLDYHAPHGDRHSPAGPEPPVRFYDTALNTRLPRPPNFNERNVRDKPRFLRDLMRKLTPLEIRTATVEWQKEIEALRAVDQGVKWVVRELRRKGELRNTYIVFTSDNGFFFGEHRISRSKFLPYEPATRVPLLVRGPGAARGAKTHELSGNIDLAPTFLQLAGARAGAPVDGRSLKPFFNRPGKRARRALVLESYTSPRGGGIELEGASASGSAPRENFIGVRVGPYKYVRYVNGQFELYDLARDPYEMSNRVSDPGYRDVRSYMRRMLQKYKDCRGRACRAVPPRWPQPRLKSILRGDRYR